MNAVRYCELNVVALVKDKERYIFLYDDDSRSYSATMETLGRFAADKHLSFTWYDAAALSKSVRRMRDEATVS